MICLFRWLLGWVEFSVCGNCGGFLSGAGADIWQVHKQSGCVRARCLLKSYRALSRRARCCGCRLRVCRHAGLPFLLKRYHLRWGLAAGALAALIFMFGSTLFVWEVDVKGNLVIPTEALLEQAREGGLHAGALIGSLDMRKMEFSLQEKFPQIAWVSINRSGGRYTLEISEADPQPEKLDREGPCNVAAAYDGVILSIEPTNGFALVKAGDVVRKDDLLVSGVKESEEHEQILYAHAEAKVVARVEREAEFVRPLTSTRVEKTGETVTVTRLELFGLTIPLDFNNPPDGPSEQSVERKPVQLFGMTLPATICTTTYTLIEQQTVQNDETQLKRLLLDDARQWETEHLQGAKILLRSAETVQEEGALKLRVRYTVEQRIDEQRPIVLS